MQAMTGESTASRRSARAQRSQRTPVKPQRTPAKKRLNAKVGTASAPTQSPNQSPTSKSPYSRSGGQQVSPAASIPDSPELLNGGRASVSPARLFGGIPEVVERYPAVDELARLRGSPDSFLGLTHLRQRASDAFSVRLGETQESLLSAQASSLGLAGPFTQSAPDILPGIEAGRTPQADRAVVDFLGRREQLALAATHAEERAQESLKRAKKHRVAKGGERTKKHADAMKRVEHDSELKKQGRAARRNAHRQKGRGHVREQMLAQAKARIVQGREAQAQKTKPKLSYIDHISMLATKADIPSAAEHSFHGELDQHGVRIAQGKTPSNIEQQIALAATLPGPGEYLPSGPHGEYALQNRPAMPGTTRAGTGAKPFQTRPPNDVEIQMRRTALLPGPGEYLIGPSETQPMGRYGNEEANTATWSATARDDCFPYSPFKYATMRGLERPGPAEYGDTNEIMFSMGGNITTPGMLRGGGRNEVDPRSDEAGVYSIAEMLEPGPGHYGAPMPLDRPNHGAPRFAQDVGVGDVRPRPSPHNLFVFVRFVRECGCVCTVAQLHRAGAVDVEG